MTTFFSTGEAFPDGYKMFCTKCPEAFTSWPSYHKHIVEKHDKAPSNTPFYACDKCCYMVHGGYRTYQKHKECHQLAHVWKCRRCLLLSSNQQGAVTHVARSSCSKEDIIEIHGKLPSQPGWSCPLLHLLVVIWQTGIKIILLTINDLKHNGVFYTWI